MANKLGSLLVQLAADTALLQRDMGKAVGIVNSNAKRMSAAMDTVKRSFAGIISVVAVQRAFKAVIAATAESEAAMRQLEARIKSTGGAAGLTAKQVAESAKKFQAASTFDDEAILAAQTRLIQFGTIAGQTFFDATQAALDLSSAMKKDLGTSALLVGKALNDPVKGLTALTRAGVSFTDQQKEQIEQMVKVGNAAGAQRIVLDALTKATGGAAKAARDTLGGALEALHNTMNDLIENDSASLPALTKAINDLNAALGDPKVKQTIDEFTSAMIDGLTWVAENGPTVAKNIDTVADAIVNLGKAFIVFKAASFGFARGGPIGGALLGTLSALELFKADIGKFLATPEVKRLLELSEQDKNAALKASLGPIANPSGLVVTIGSPQGKSLRPAQSPTIDKEAEAAEKRRVESIQNIIDKLKEEEFAVGRSDAAMVAYNLTLLKAPAALIAEAQAIAEKTQAHKNDLEIIEKERAAREDLIKLVKDEQAEVIRGLMTQDAAIRTAAALKIERVLMAAEESVEIERNAAAMIANIHKEADEQIAKLHEDTANDISAFAVRAAENIQDTLGDQLFNILQGKFDGIGDQFKATLDRMVANALAAKLGEKLFGDYGKTGQIGGLVGKILPAIFGSTNAKGNAFSGGNVIPFARGGVVSRPTIFPMAKGAGLMGEAGPEAILPLMRTSGGELGVKASGGGGSVVVNITVNGIQDARGIREATANLAAKAGAAIELARQRNA